MTFWLLDASVLLASEDPDDDHHDDAVWLLECGDRLVTLDLAYYEVANVAVRSWRDQSAARRLAEKVAAIAMDGGLYRADSTLMASAAAIAENLTISVYDAAYAAAARDWECQLVSCDVRDLVSRDLALLPGGARTGSQAAGSS